MGVWTLFYALAGFFVVLTITDPTWTHIVPAVSFTVAAIAARHAERNARR